MPRIDTVHRISNNNASSYWLYLFYSAAFSEKTMSEDECLLSDSEECIAYHKKLVDLYTTIHNDWLEEEQSQKMKQARDLVQEIQAVKLSEPEYAAGADSPALRQAVASAKKASEKYGADSAEARLAWETVEEIGAARNYENAMGGALSEDECLVEKIEACEGLEEIKKVIVTPPEKKEWMNEGVLRTFCVSDNYNSEILNYCVSGCPRTCVCLQRFTIVKSQFIAQSIFK